MGRLKTGVAILAAWLLAGPAGAMEPWLVFVGEHDRWSRPSIDITGDGEILMHGAGRVLRLSPEGTVLQDFEVSRCGEALRRTVAATPDGGFVIGCDCVSKYAADGVGEWSACPSSHDRRSYVSREPVAVATTSEGIIGFAWRESHWQGAPLGNEWWFEGHFMRFETTGEVIDSHYLGGSLWNPSRGSDSVVEDVASDGAALLTVDFTDFGDSVPKSTLHARTRVGFEASAGRAAGPISVRGGLVGVDGWASSWPESIEYEVRPPDGEDWEEWRRVVITGPDQATYVRDSLLITIDADGLERWSHAFPAARWTDMLLLDDETLLLAGSVNGQAAVMTVGVDGTVTDCLETVPATFTVTPGSVTNGTVESLDLNHDVAFGDGDDATECLDCSSPCGGCDQENAEPSAVDLDPLTEPLRVARFYGALDLSWEDLGDAHYALHAGTLTSLRAGVMDHVPLECSLTRPGHRLLRPPAGDVYFLAAVPCAEGADFGRDSFGRPRPRTVRGCP